VAWRMTWKHWKRVHFCLPFPGRRVERSR